MKTTRRTLDEVASKALLRRYGVTTTEPRLARTADEAVRIATELGGRVVMKIVSIDLPHKSAVGGVRLDVAPVDAASAFGAIRTAVAAARPEARVDGVMIEPMAAPGLEVFVGGKRDPQFGAVLLIGRGGVDVEQTDRIDAELAPLSPTRARVVARRLLAGRIAAESAVERLAMQFVALAGEEGLLMQEPVVEFDVNPIIVTETDVRAVDGLIILDDAPDEDRSSATGLARIREAREGRLTGMAALFEPRAIAVVGASTNTAKLGYRLMANLVAFGFAGDLYPIHPTATEICGVKAYPSIDAIPDVVDRALIAVPAKDVPDILARCAAKGIRVAQVLTAGFSEWTDADDQSASSRLEQRMLDAIRDTGLRMVGPNCIGTYSAHARMPLVAPRYSRTEPGGITFYSQSGTFAGDIGRRSHAYGVAVGRILSCGNCLDLDAVDFLLANEADPASTLSAFYVESIRDPAVFFRIAASATKPIVLLKGGRTSQGLAAASSHTAALASDARLWDAGIALSGIVEVGNAEEMMDLLLAFSTMGLPPSIARRPGNRIGIFGSGGGVSVISADVSTRVGLEITDLGDAAVAGLRRFGVPGTSVGNPIDIPVWGLLEEGRYIFGDVVDLLKSDPGIDTIVVYLEPGSVLDFADDEAHGLSQLDAMCASIAACRAGGPPVAVSLRTSGAGALDDFVRRQRLSLGAQGIAVFPTTTRALRAQAGLWRLAQRWGQAS